MRLPTANWIFPINKRDENHRGEIESFVDCYFLFSGVAGICNSCQAKDICIGINVDNGHEPPKGYTCYYKYLGGT